MNKIFLIGRIVKDLELRVTANNKPVCEFTIAVDRIGASENQQKTDFINCIVWNKQAENLVKFQGKGSLIAILGSLRVEQYEYKNEKKYKTYILVQEISFLENKKVNSTAATQTETQVNDPYKEFANETLLTDDELPF